jgi:predicted Ser/Thr protein kinase
MLLKCCNCDCEIDSDPEGPCAACPHCGDPLVPSPTAANDSSESLSRLDTATMTHAAPACGWMQRYRLSRCLGRGGFGEVFLARDDDLGRDVAIKIPRRDRFRSEASVAAFLGEARIAANLKHPAIATIYDVGRDANVGCFIAMEYVEGTVLSTLLVQGALPPNVAAKLVAEIAAAAHYAHTQGIVHRDLKPSNIIIDRRQQPHILDFGLGLSDADRDGHPAGGIAGTPRYMPPEQGVPDFPAIDGRADIWSIGVILYQALTGRYPFAGNMAQAIEAARLYDPKPPRQIDDTIPPELERITLRCLSKLPRDRYSTAKDLADELHGWLADHATARSGAPAVKSVGVWNFGRRRVIALGLGAVLTVLIALGVVALRRDASGRLPDLPIAPGQRELRENGWHDLLQFEPQEFIYPGEEPAGNLAFSAVKRSVFINSLSPALVETGSTDQRDFRLTVGLAKNETHGRCGIWFGLRPAPDGKADSWTCQAVHLEFSDPSMLFVSRSLMTIDRESNGELIVRNFSTLRSVPVDNLELRESTLTLVVRNTMLVDVRWDGRVLPRLTELREGLEFNEETADSAVGRFGLFNANGGAAFLNHLYMPEQ